jgi:hypothetical protein
MLKGASVQEESVKVKHFRDPYYKTLQILNYGEMAKFVAS